MVPGICLMPFLLAVLYEYSDTSDKGILLENLFEFFLAVKNISSVVVLSILQRIESESVVIIKSKFCPDRT